MTFTLVDLKRGSWRFDDLKKLRLLPVIKGVVGSEIEYVVTESKITRDDASKNGIQSGNDNTTQNFFNQYFNHRILIFKGSKLNHLYLKAYAKKWGLEYNPTDFIDFDYLYRVYKASIHFKSLGMSLEYSSLTWMAESVVEIAHAYGPKSFDRMISAHYSKDRDERLSSDFVYPLKEIPKVSGYPSTLKGHSFPIPLITSKLLQEEAIQCILNLGGIVTSKRVEGNTHQLISDVDEVDLADGLLQVPEVRLISLMNKASRNK